MKFLDEVSCYLRKSFDINCKNFRSSLLSIFFSLFYFQDYLITDVLAFRKAKLSIPELFDSVMDTDDDFNESSNSRKSGAELTEYFSQACNALGFNLPPQNVTTSQIFSNLHQEVSNKLLKCKKGYLGRSMVPIDGLSDKQWAQVTRLIALLQQDYSSRRGTLLKRLDVTVQSFKWSDKAQKQLEEIDDVYFPLRKAMNKHVHPGIPQLLAARDDPLLFVDKTSGASRRRFTACELNKVLIGRVPDRGGRAWELEPPPPEMPVFKKRQNAPANHGGFRGGRGSHGQGNRSRGDYRNRGSNNTFSNDVRDNDGYIQYGGDRHTGGLVFYGDPNGQEAFNASYQYNRPRGRGGRGAKRERRY